MHALLSRLRGGDDQEPCRCRPRFEGDRLVVDASDCPGEGRLASSEDCRETVVEALTERDADAVRTVANGTQRVYEDNSAAFLVTAGRFADAAAFHDERLAERATRDPLAAAREATGRAGPVNRIAAETGLAEGVARAETYESALRPFVGPTVSRSRVAARPPADARLCTRRELDTDAVVRVYERPADAVRTYHLEPAEFGFDDDATATLASGYERLANGKVAGSERAPGRAVRSVANPDDPVERLTAVLRKHARGYGVVADLFADPEVSDVFATAPVESTSLHVRVDGERMRTNVRLTRDGAASLASRFRRESGRAFSGADPTLDATVETANRRIRVAAVTDPVSEGVAFAFRAGDREAWTLPALVANGTLTADAAALLSLAVERGGAGLVAGPRGSGKTTCLSALLWEVPPETRTVVIEDTPELSVDALQSGGRDIQALRSSLDGTGPSPAEALRTALRLGSGGIVVGEIRGEAAGTLYEAMRVGANDGAVLGTIHGDGGDDVRERVVTDLGVAPNSFAATDFLVTLETAQTEQETQRRVRCIEEVHRTETGDVTFSTLYDRRGDGLCSTDRIERGNSHLVASLSRPEETYADLRTALSERAEWLEGLVSTGRTDPETVERARVEQVVS